MKMKSSPSNLILSFLLILLGQHYFLSSAQAQSNTTYETATYLCNTNLPYTLHTPPSNVPAQVGPDYGCNPGAVNANWFRFQVAAGSRLHWQLLPVNNSNLDFILWGPYNNPNPGATSLTSGNIRYCTNNPILIENLDVSPVTSGGYYILAVFNSDRTPGNFSFIPQAGNDVILGSSIISAPGNPGSVVECTPPFTIATYPDAASITGLTFTGNGITNSSTGVFSPSVAGIGSHTITISGSPYGCAQRIGTYTINVTPCPYPPSISNPSGRNVICWNSFLPPLFAVSPSYPSGITHVSWVWEYKLAGTTNWVSVVPTPSPDNSLVNFVVTGSLEIRVRDILSNGVSVSSAPVAFTVLNPIQVPVVSLGSGTTNSTLCNGAALNLTATAANGGGNSFQYEWQRRLVPAGSWVTITSGGPNTNLNLPSVTQSAEYRIIATDISIRNCGSVLSDPILITVQAVVNQGSIGTVALPSELEACMDNSVTINSINPATGSGTIAYQWYVSTDNLNWNAVGGNTPSYTAPALGVPGRRFYRRQATSTQNGVVCPSTPEYSNVVSVTWIDDFPFVSAARLHEFDGPFSHNWQVSSGGSTISGQTSNGITITTPSATNTNPTVSAFYRLSSNVVPFDGIVSFNAEIEYFNPTYTTSCTGSWSNTPNSSISNLQKSFEISGIPSDLGSGGVFSFRVRQGESIGFTIGLTGSDVASGGAVCFNQRIRLNITNFAYHRRSANGSADVCANLPHTIPSAAVASIPAATFSWSVVQGTGSLNNNLLINPTYTPGAGDAGTTVVLRLTASRTTGLCAGRTATADYSINYRPVFVAAAVNPGQDRIVCYNGVGGQFTATPATGGSGPYAYQWQSSTDGGSWVNVSGATSLTFNALTPLTDNTCYRIVSTDIGIPACALLIPSASTACVTVRRPLTAPDINNSSPVRVCPSQTATLVCSTWATGGNGVFKYTWEVVSAAQIQPGSPSHNWPWVSVPGYILLNQPSSGPLTLTTPPMYCGADLWYRLVAQDQEVTGRLGCGTAWSVPVLVQAYDVTPPTITAINGTTLFVGANCSTTVTNVLSLVSSWNDNCPGGLWDWKINPSTFGLGLNQVAVISARDTCGNVGSVSVTLNVRDNTNPVAIANNITVDLNAAGTVTPSPALADAGSTDNCSIASRQLIPPTFNCSNIGPNNVVFRVTDGSGNTNQTNIIVTVRDVTPPVVSGCPSNVTLIGYNNGAGSSCVSGYSWTPPTFTDNCDNNISVVASHTPCHIFAQGNTTVTYTATDDYGNSTTCSFVVTVLPATGGCAPSNPDANPLIEITNVQGNCIGGTLTADIRISRYSGSLGAISMFLDYNSAVLGNPVLTFTNPVLSSTGATTSNNPGAGDYRIGWNWSGTGNAFICDNAVLFTVRYDILSGGNSTLVFDQALSVNCEIANQTYSVIPNVIFRGANPVSTIPCNGFSGTLTYDNTASSPIPNTQIELLNGSGVVVSTGTTLSNGSYHLPGGSLTVGQTYNVRYTNPNEWRNAVNATDALGIQRHFVGLGLPLSGLPLAAADVNGSGTVTTADAALVRARYTGQISSFTPNVDWVYSVNTLTYSGGLSTVNIKTLNTGDVNRSRPAVPRFGFADVPTKGMMNLEGELYRADLISMESRDVSALSLELKVPAGSVVAVVEAFDGEEEIVWNQTGDVLFVAWNNLNPRILKDGDVFLSIFFSSITDGGLQRSITTEFAGPWADVYGDFQFAAPQLRKSVQSAGVIGLYPNPTTGEVQFTDVVERVTVVDIHGRVVMEENDSAIKGLSLAMLPKGIYIVELTKNGVLSQHKVVLKD